MQYLFLSPLFLTALVPAQRTWIVDAAGGPGVHFPDIPPAVAAAQDGDTIVVRAANVGYQTVLMTKALRIVGVDAPRLVPDAALDVRGISAGKSFAFVGFTFDPGPALRVADCAGPVILDGLHGRPGFDNAFGLRIDRSTAVSVSNCSLRGTQFQPVQPTAVSVVDSGVVLTNCELRGPDLTLPWSSAATALRSLRSRIVLNGCLVVGGRLLASPVDLAPAVVAADGVLVATGGTTIVGAGTLAIDGTTTAVVESAGAIRGAIATGVSVLRAQVPASSAGQPLLPRSVLHVRCAALPGDFVIQGVGLLRQPVSGPFGEEWLDPASMLVLDVGRVTTGVRWVEVPLPFGRGALTGLTLASQALVLRGQTVVWSTPAAVVLE